MGKFDTLIQQASATMLSLLDDMFASCDDLYFDLASAAANNKEQATYFESMREVRVRSNGSKQSFEKQLAEKFDALINAKIDSHHTDNILAEPSELSIVDNEETERQVTLTAMISRSRAISRSCLHEIEHRLKHFAKPNFKIDEDSNPVDPDSIVKMFAVATDEMDLLINARIILYKQFERIVLKRLPEFYNNFNKRLEESGASFERSKGSPSAKRPAPGSLESAVAGLDDGESLVSAAGGSMIQIPLGELTGLLRNQQGIMEQGIPLFRSEGGGTPIDSDQLVNLLNQAPALTQGTKAPFDLRSFLASTLRKSGPNKEPQAVTKVDEDIINLVAMFFDFALDDDDIPDSIKALLSRLQMPTLKIAIKESTFFSNAEHPCRQFINRIAQLSIGLATDDKESAPLLEAIEQWIHKIQSETEDIEAAFSKAMQELELLFEKVEKRSTLVEKRTAEAAEGDAIKQVARLKAQQAIEEMLDGKHIDSTVSEFISEYWQKVLYGAYMRSGSESSEWTSCLQVMQDLAWCAQPHQGDKKAQTRRERILIDLEERIATGMALTPLTADQIKSLSRSVIEAASSYQDASDQNDKAAVSVFIAAENKSLDLIDDPQKHDEFSEASNDEEHADEDHLDGESTSEGYDGDDSTSAVQRQKDRYNQRLYEFIQTADEIDIGTWLEFKVPSQGTTMRCKLSLKIEDTDTFVFVNRFGFKALEKSKRAFAEDLHRNRARILRSGPLFDRSLGSVIKSLRKSA